MSEQTAFPRAGFLRRLAAMIYDVLVAVAVGMCAALVAIVVLVILLENNVLDKQGMEHSSSVIQASPLYKTLIQIWVGAWVLGFFVWFWRNGGQTIGMRAWRLRLFSTTDQPLTYSRALWRTLCSLGGLGTLLVFWMSDISSLYRTGWPKQKCWYSAKRPTIMQPGKTSERSHLRIVQNVNKS